MKAIGLLLLLTVAGVADLIDPRPVYGRSSAPQLAELPQYANEARQEASRITDALDAYQSRYGSPPHSLSSLIPEFLEQLPYPGSSALSDWCYWDCGASWVLGVVVVSEDSREVTLAYGKSELPSEITGLGQLRGCHEKWGLYW